MALIYVRSGSGGTPDGLTKTTAWLTLAAAFAAGAAGDTFYVASDHAETQASALSLTSPGTFASPCKVICVDFAGSTPPVAADERYTATITTTGNFALTLVSGYTYWQGIIFAGGSGVTAQGVKIGDTSGSNKFKRCGIRKPGTSGTAGALTFGTTTAGVRSKQEFEDCTYEFGHVSDGVALRQCDFTWEETRGASAPSAIAGAIFPTTLFQGVTPNGGNALLRGLDLSALGAGKTLIGAIASPKRFVLLRNKLNASVTIAAAPTDMGGAEVIVVGSDSGATNYRQEKHQAMGVQTTETTIVRTGGATDGVTPIAWKIITSADSERTAPFESLPFKFWNTNVAPITVDIHGVWGGGAVPNSADIWIEATYLSDAASGQAAKVSSAPASIITAGSALSTDGSTWGGSTTKFKMSVTFTPAQQGPVEIVVKAALASTTFYIDPQPVVSGVDFGKSYIVGPGVYVNELGTSDLAEVLVAIADVRSALPDGLTIDGLLKVDALKVEGQSPSSDETLATAVADKTVAGHAEGTIAGNLDVKVSSRALPFTAI